MNCSNCQHPNPENAKFCNNCGQPLASGCSSCGAENPAGAKFCNQCGNNLLATETPSSQPPKSAETASPRDYTPKHLADKILNSRSAMEGERKQVTVLFADLKGSMDLAEEVGAERWHEVLDEFFSILGDEIHRMEGTINQYTGDGVMALFGAPVSHEDHAARACNTALALKEKLREFAQRIRQRDGVNFSTRIGLNSGEVIVGRIGDDLRMDYTAQGHTVGLAARMEALAEPGTVYLTRYTAALVEGYFKLTNLGPTKVKGVSKPLEIYALEGSGKLRNRLEVSRSRGLSKFVGRESETDKLAKHLAFPEGKGVFITVEGDAGIGKSRLCYELAESAKQQGIDVFTAACVPYHDAAPFLPVKELIAAYFNIEENDTPALARQKIAGSLTLMGLADAEALHTIFEFLDIADPSSEINLPAETRQQRVLQVYHRFNELAPDRRSITIVDDLHWADQGSLEFLKAMLLEVHSKPVTVVFNFRPHQKPDWFTEAFEHIQLKPLGDEAVAELATELLGRAPELEALKDKIVARAAGNPYFVEEAVRSLVEAGALEGDIGFLQPTATIANVDMPDTIHALIAARIDRLPEQDKIALQTAAVIGSQFERQLLQAITGAAEQTFAAQLARLETNGFIQTVRVDDDCDELQPCHWEFRHPLIQEVAYRSQLKSTRQQVHAQLALQLEPEVEKQRTHNDSILRLAHHWERAKVWDKAAKWMVEAAGYQAGKDLGDALRRFRRSIEIFDKAPQSGAILHARVAARSGIMRIATFYNVVAEEIDRLWQEAKSITDTTGDKASLAELQISYGLAQLQYSDADEAVENTVAALQTVRSAPNAGELESRFRISLMIAFFGAGRVREGLELLTDGSTEAWTTTNVNEENFYSRGFRALMISYMGELNQASRDLHAAIEMAEKRQVPVSWFYANLVEYCNLSGNADEALTAAMAAVKRAEDYGSPFFLSNSYRQLGLAHCLNRQWPEAITAIEHVEPLSHYGQPGYQFRAVLLAVLSRAYLGNGDIAKAKQIGEEAIQLAMENHVRLAECQARLTMLSILRKQGENGVEHHLQRIEQLIDETGAIMFTPFMQEERARLLWRTGQTEAGASLLKDAYSNYLRFGAAGHAARLNKNR